MKKLLLILPFAAGLIGCSNSDAKFADHAPGADSAARLASYAPQKPGIPPPKATTAMPAVLKN